MPKAEAEALLQFTPAVTSPPFGGEVGLSGPGEGASHAQQTQQTQRTTNAEPSPRPIPQPSSQTGEVTNHEPHFELDDPTTDRARLRDLATWCRRFSPVVGVEDASTPECLLINIEGIAHLFNNERAMARHVLEELQNVKLYARVAIADTVGMSWAVAHYGTAASRQSKRNTPVIVPEGEAQQTLQSLPSLALRLPDDVMETLNELDLLRVHQLLNLPKPTLPSRFGDILHKRIYQALGEIPEPITPELPPKQTIQRWRFEYTISDRRVIEMGIERLLTRTIESLEPERHGVQRLHILLQGELGELTDFSVGLMRPSISHSHLMRLIRTQLERVRTPDDICEISVELISSSPLDPRQETLFACRDEAKARREREQLLERISSRLGENAVVTADAVPDAQPELAFQYGEVTNHTPVTSPPFGGEVGLSGPGEGAAHTQQPEHTTNPKPDPLPRLKPRPLPQAGEVTDAGSPGLKQGTSKTPQPNAQPPVTSPPFGGEVGLSGPGEGAAHTQQPEHTTNPKPGPLPQAGEVTDAGSPALQRPVNLQTAPKPIDVITLAATGPPTSVRWNGRSNPISKCWGPERIHTGWWRDDNIVRDYYRVETDQGLRLWIFRNVRNGEWFLHGVFD